MLALGNEEGDALGFIAEEDRGFLGSVARQAFATHRPFRAVVLDASGSPILWVGERTFSIHFDLSLLRSCDVLFLGLIPACTYNA
jgi:hypothetical protein